MWDERKLNDLLADPSDALAADMGRLAGDILVVGASGKMGPSLCALAVRASKKAGAKRRVIAAARFSDPASREYLEGEGVECVPCDLLEEGVVERLPDAPYVIFMAGRKFGTDGREPDTWAMNAWLPSSVARRFRNSRITVFSSGNVYPMADVRTGGCTEEVKPSPMGEYAMSCLARERVFEYFSKSNGTPVLLLRLNYAADLRYGVLYDIARNILDRKPVPLRTPMFNCLWQGSANEYALRSLLQAGSPAQVLNITGPEALSVRRTAVTLGGLLGVEPVFIEEESGEAYLSDASRAFTLFGYPRYPADTLIRWQAEWLMDGGSVLDKPTHFEVRSGRF